MTGESCSTALEGADGDGSLKNGQSLEIGAHNRVQFTQGHEDVVDSALAWLEAGRAVAIATVIRTWGSSPRPAGSQLAVNDRLALAGSVSAGCVESAVVNTALEVIRDSQPRRLAFGVSDADAWQVGLPCGGKIELYVESVTAKRSLLEQLQMDRLNKRTVVLATALASGNCTFFYPFESMCTSPAWPDTDDTLTATLRTWAKQDRSGIIPRPDGDWFLHVRNPLPRMLIVGAVHVAQSLGAMALLNGFEVVIVDPRAAFATAERFPDVTLCLDWPDQALRRLKPDRRTAIVTLTHNPKLDDPALVIAARSGAFYVGALGSRRSHAKRLERLAQLGLLPHEQASIKAPVGLGIGAITTAEIATSIMAEVIQELRRETSTQ